MALINEHYLKLTAGYLFPEIARRTGAFQEKHPGADVIRMGIGDVVKGIPRVVAEAMKEAVEEMAHDESFQGYPPGEGYDFLIDAIVEHEYASRGVEVAADEVIVSDGLQVRFGQHPGDLRHRQHRRPHRPGLPGLLRQQRHGRPHRSRRGRRPLCRPRLPAVHGGIRGFCLRFPTAMSTSSTSARRTTRRGR